MTKRELRWYDLFTLNVYWMGLTALSQTLGLIFPLLIQDFVGETSKGSYLGMLRLWTLMVALLMQAVMGIFSDRSHHAWGRRRPFILTGTIADLFFIVGVGFSAGVEGLSGFWFLFIMAIFLQASSNTAHAAQQGLIPDLVPDQKRGLYSGFKALLELPIPLIIVSFTIGKFIGRGNFWMGLSMAVIILIITMLITMLVPEKRFEEKTGPLDWTPFIRLVLMTTFFTLIILGAGELVRLAGRILGEIQAGASTLVYGMGILGLLGMLVAIALGVWISVQISIGKDAAQRNPSYTWWVMNRLAFLVGTTNLSAFAVYFIQARLGYPKETAVSPAANLMLVVGVCILIFVLPAGWLSDRFGKKKVVFAAGIIATIGTLIALSAPSLNVIYIGGIFIGGATGLFFTSNWALGTSLVPKTEAGKYLGISNLAGAGAGAVGAYIGGPIADTFTKYVPNSPGLGYAVLFSIYGIIFLLSTLALVKIKDNKQATPLES
jgi:MFS family permease